MLISTPGRMRGSYLGPVLNEDAVKYDCLRGMVTWTRTPGFGKSFFIFYEQPSHPNNSG